MMLGLATGSWPASGQVAAAGQQQTAKKTQPEQGRRPGNANTCIFHEGMFLSFKGRLRRSRALIAEIAIIINLGENGEVSAAGEDFFSEPEPGMADPAYCRAISSRLNKAST